MRYRNVIIAACGLAAYSIISVHSHGDDIQQPERARAYGRLEWAFEPVHAWDLSEPVYTPPETPAWAKATVPEWVKPFQGKNGLPDPYHFLPASPCGNVVIGIDRYQGNLFVPYRPETATYLYADYTPTNVGYVPGTFLTYERIVAEFTDDEMSETEKALALLDKALPAVFRHGGPPNRGWDDADEALLLSGQGPCSEEARIFVRLCQVAGLQGRIVHLFGQQHTIAEFYADGRWVLADCTFHFVARDADGNLLSAAECHDRDAGQRAYAEAKRRACERLLAMSDEEINARFNLAYVRNFADPRGHPERVRTNYRNSFGRNAELADEVPERDDVWFGVINYPLPPATTNAVTIKAITVERLDRVAVELYNHLQSRGVWVDVDLRVDESEPARQRFLVGPRQRLPVVFDLAEPLRESHRIGAAVDYRKPLARHLSDWENELIFETPEREKLYDVNTMPRVNRMATAPVIDGDLAEWRGRPHLAVGGADKQLRAEIYAGWDAAAFYLAAAVTDAQHFNAQRGGRIWNGDSLNFVIAPRGPDIEPFDLGLALPATGQAVLHQWIRAFQGSGANLIANSDYAVTRDDKQGKTFYEVRIPFAMLGIEPVPGVAFGFNVAVFDDQDGEGADRWIELKPGLAAYKLRNDPAPFKPVAPMMLWEE